MKGTFIFIQSLPLKYKHYFLCKKFSLTDGLCQHSPNLKSVYSLQEQDIYALGSKEYLKQFF